MSQSCVKTRINFKYKYSKNVEYNFHIGLFPFLKVMGVGGPGFENDFVPRYRIKMNTNPFMHIFQFSRVGFIMVLEKTTTRKPSKLLLEDSILFLFDY